MTILDLLRATLPKRCTYDDRTYLFAKSCIPDGNEAQIDVLAQAISWTVSDVLDTMKFEEETEHGQ